MPPRPLRGFPLLAAAALLAAGPAAAQKAPPPSKPVAKYLGLDLTMVPSDLMSDLDASVRLVSQAGKLSSASLDACLAPSPVSSRLDRLAGALTVDGTAVRGSGTSEVMGKPWSIEVRQAKAGNATKVTGKLEYDGKAYPISGDDAVLSDDPPPTEVDEGGEGEGASAPVESLNLVEVTVPAGRPGDLARLVREAGGAVLPPTSSRPAWTCGAASRSSTPSPRPRRRPASSPRSAP